MNKAMMTILCLTTGLAYAGDEEEHDNTVPEVSTRLEMIEEINVTAEKSPVETGYQPDEELEAILNEAEEFDEETSE
jgi:hypothetical protein